MPQGNTANTPWHRVHAMSCYLILPVSVLFGWWAQHPLVRFHSRQSWYFVCTLVVFMVLCDIGEVVTGYIAPELTSLWGAMTGAGLVLALSLLTWTMWRISQGKRGAMPCYARRVRRNTGVPLQYEEIT